ncbi:MAG: hypothetical protein JOZ53_20955 [Planctomycetaceae bacterium]|nr:hypothetical protein [Planctomycetaceae bacterium]
MSMSSSDPAAPGQDAPVAPGPTGGGWSLVALIANEGLEPPAGLPDRDALATWCAASTLWHPSLLALAGALPKVESVESPTSPSPREVRVLAVGSADRLPAGYRTQAEDVGCIVVEAGGDRPALLRAIRERLGKAPASASWADEGEAGDPVALDFLALGAARWWLGDLTIAMGHVEGLDNESLTREVLAGAAAWRSGDRPAAVNRLRAAFELLTQARERFYPVDAYLIDVCLIDPTTPVGALADALTTRTPVTFLAPARAIEELSGRDPDGLVSLRAAISEGWADVVGGAYDEVDEPLLPIESISWQFRQGAEVYRRHLDGHHVETVARRRFGLYPQLPQLAKRFGFRFAVHLGFDAGRFPIRPESKRLWESPDGSTLETLTRPPLGADRPATGLQIPWRLALTMKDDHVATLPLVHWPSPVAPWYPDLRRAATYSPVLARWVTLNDYFHLTGRPFEHFRPGPDEYVTPYLAQAVARRDPRPISRRAMHTRLRARVDALSTLRAFAFCLSTGAPGSGEGDLSDAETALETGRLDEAGARLDRQEPAWAAILARGLVGSGRSGRPGYLVINPLGIARRAAVHLPDAALDLRPEGPLLAAQSTADGVWAVVELPPFGFAWVPREASVKVPPAAAGALSARDRVLRNEALVVEIDEATGGIRGIRSPREDTARIGERLVVSGLTGPDESPSMTRMRSESFAIDYAGPALVQAVARGTLTDPRNDRRLASFHQRYRLWSGRPILELDITLGELDPDWLDRAAEADPWTHHLACRWAWLDPDSMLRRTCLLAPELTEVDRPETPDAFDISTRRQRTAVLFGGLAHHRRHGTRMLDTLLIAGREAARTFRLGVALDLEHPFRAAVDLISPAFVVPTDAGPPPTGPTGWLFHLDTKAVAVTRVEYADPSGDGRGWGVVFHLVEAAGTPARCRLRTFRNPVWARLIDFQNEPIVDLTVDGDAVLIDLRPHEIARVDITLG